MLRLALFVLSGCQLVFPLAAADAPGGDDGAIRPLIPPDGASACPAAPDLGSWGFVGHPIAGFTDPIEHPTFTTADTVMFTSRGKLYESPLAGPASEIGELALVDGSEIRGVAAAPSTDVVWFERASVTAPSAGLYVASRRDGTWTARRADFGIVAYQIEVGSVGFHDGTARMIIGFTPTPADRIRLLELESVDGAAWTQLDTLSQISDGSVAADFEPSLSADGCTLVFHRLTDIYVAQRGADGTFAKMTAIPQLAGGMQPAIAPDVDRIWCNLGGLVEGTPSP